jgi:hypothetical protein
MSVNVYREPSFLMDIEISSEYSLVKQAYIISRRLSNNPLVNDLLRIDDFRSSNLPIFTCVKIYCTRKRERVSESKSEHIDYWITSVWFSQ